MHAAGESGEAVHYCKQKINNLFLVMHVIILVNLKQTKLCEGMCGALTQPHFQLTAMLKTRDVSSPRRALA